jgi:predicted Zn-ribbon and HTH transcriptional regulator
MLMAIDKYQAAKIARLKGLKKKMKEINIHSHRCTRCGYKWKGRSENPTRCAKCNSQYWNRIPVRPNAKINLEKLKKKEEKS